MVDIVISSAQLELAHGFGINTNLLETNLINLAVVIGILTYYGKGVLLETLGNRRNTILNQIEDAKRRLAEAKSNLAQAEKDLELAKAKAITIHADAESIIELKTIDLTAKLHERKKRLKEANVAIISFENNKVFTAMRQRLFRIALEQVREYLSKRITPDLHTKINDYQLSVLKSITK